MNETNQEKKNKLADEFWEQKDKLQYLLSEMVTNRAANLVISNTEFPTHVDEEIADNFIASLEAKIHPEGVNVLVLLLLQEMLKRKRIEFDAEYQSLTTPEHMLEAEIELQDYKLYDPCKNCNALAACEKAGLDTGKPKMAHNELERMCTLETYYHNMPILVNAILKSKDPDTLKAIAEWNLANAGVVNIDDDDNT